jgi:hypothetical protein
MKSTIKLITRIDSKGNAVVFGSGEVAAEITGCDVRLIRNCDYGNLTMAGGYMWKDSSVAEIDQFFREMALSDLSQDFSRLSSNSRYGNLLKSIKLCAKWKKAISS